MTAALLALIAGGAGLVYGFAGFGSALIAVPLYAALVGPGAAVGLMAVTALGSAVTVLPRALRRADRRASAAMLVPALACLPFGTLALRRSDPDMVRWAMSGLVLATLVALLAGWRHRGRAGMPAWLGIGALVGLCGGATGLTGPPLVLFQLAGRDGAERSRANTIVVLTSATVALLPVLWWRGIVGGAEIATGLALIPVYAAATWAGQRLFDAGREDTYRRAAYAVIAAAAIAGLPLWR